MSYVATTDLPITKTSRTMTVFSHTRKLISKHFTQTSWCPFRKSERWWKFSADMWIANTGTCGQSHQGQIKGGRGAMAQTHQTFRGEWGELWHCRQKLAKLPSLGPRPPPFKSGPHTHLYTSQVKCITHVTGKYNSRRNAGEVSNQMSILLVCYFLGNSALWKRDYVTETPTFSSCNNTWNESTCKSLIK